MMMMQGLGRESGDGEIGRTPEQPARPRGSGAGLAGGGGFGNRSDMAWPEIRMPRRWQPVVYTLLMQCYHALIIEMGL